MHTFCTLFTYNEEIVLFSQTYYRTEKMYPGHKKNILYIQRYCVTHSVISGRVKVGPTPSYRWIIKDYSMGNRVSLKHVVLHASCPHYFYIDNTLCMPTTQVLHRMSKNKLNSKHLT